MQEEEGSPPRFSFPELIPNCYTEHNSACCSELSSSTSTPFVSAPSSPTARTRSATAFYFSTAPTSPAHKQAFDFPHFPLPPTSLHLRQSSTADPISSPSRAVPTAPLHHATSNGSLYSLQADRHTRSSSLQAEHPISSPKSLQITPHHERTSSWAPQTEHHMSFPLPHRSYQSEFERSTNWGHPSETEHNSSYKLSYQSQHGIRSPRSLHTASNALQTELARNPLGSHASLQIKDNLQYTTNSNFTQNPQPIITDFANHKPLKRLLVEDIDASYSRNASAVPFSWEEKPGTPKARSITSEASNGEDDSPSNLLSGSSEFEFSARFSELEDPPMSPTPISSPFNSFNHQYAYGSPSPTHAYTYRANPYMQNETANEDQIRPLRRPPRLDNPILTKLSIKDERNELKRSHGSLASLSAPQSPRSPRIFDLRGAFCGISSPVGAVFDPFLTAMEKSMAKNGDEEEMRKSPKKKTNRSSHGHHRRTQSLSPLRVFHWDDHSAKSNSSSNGSSTTDEVKNKHPIQKEINARHSAGTPKGSKRWSFKSFLHRKSVSGGENARHSNTSASLRSSGRESCSSSGMGEGPSDSNILASMPSTPSSILSPSSSNNSSKGKINTNKGNKGPYALHYSMQRAHTEELRKKTFLPYKQGLLGCLGLSSKSYRALATLSKPLQSVS